MNLNKKRLFRKNLIIMSLGLALSACGSDSAEEIMILLTTHKTQPLQLVVRQ